MILEPWVQTIQPTFLLVEDDEICMALLSKCVKSVYENVFEVSDGQAAINWISQTDAQQVIVLLDVKLPKLSGPSVLSMIKARDDVGRFEVIMCTGNPISNEGLPYTELGAAATLVKPFSMVKLRDTIKRVIKSRYKQLSPPQS